MNSRLTSDRVRWMRMSTDDVLVKCVPDVSERGESISLAALVWRWYIAQESRILLSNDEIMEEESSPSRAAREEIITRIIHLRRVECFIARFFGSQLVKWRQMTCLESNEVQTRSGSNTVRKYWNGPNFSPNVTTANTVVFQIWTTRFHSLKPFISLISSKMCLLSWGHQI